MTNEELCEIIDIILYGDIYEAPLVLLKDESVRPGFLLIEDLEVQVKMSIAATLLQKYGDS